MSEKGAEEEPESTCWSRFMESQSQLRIAQISMQVLTFIAGMLTSVPLGWTTRTFGEKCLLYTKMSISVDDNDTFIMDPDVVWGNINYCYYSTFTAVMAIIYAIIWVWFYVMISDWGRRPMESGHMPDKILLVPTVLGTCILFVCTIIAAGCTTGGTNYWCQQLLQTEVFMDRDCSYAHSKTWKNVPDGQLAHRYLFAAVIGSWILVVSLVGQFILAILRARLYAAQQRRYYLEAHGHGFSSDTSTDSEDELSGNPPERKDSEQLYYNRSFDPLDDSELTPESEIKMDLSPMEQHGETSVDVHNWVATHHDGKGSKKGDNQ